MKLPILIRRAKLMEWLVDGAGLTESVVRVMIENGTIPREHFKHPRRVKKAGSKKASKQRPTEIDGHAWYRPKAIAQALNIDLPQ